MEKQFKPLILIVEDDESIAILMQIYLEKEGYRVQIVGDGKQALQLYEQVSPSLILLDLMIPEIDGIILCQHIRRMSNIPIIMVTAKTQTHDKVKGFEAGADDYLAKPFDPPELVARVKAVLRRCEQPQRQQICFENLMIDMSTFMVMVDEQQLILPPKEMELFYFLASHPNQVFNREHILERVWGQEFEGDPRTVDVHIKRIREKIERPDRAWNIRTVWGVGYKFEVKETELAKYI